MTRTALPAGATGLVGGRLLQLLADESVYSTIHVLTRRELPSPHPHVEVHGVDLETLEAWSHLFTVDEILCALGATTNTTGSREAFKAVDLAIPAEPVRPGVAGETRRFLMDSSSGADPG